MDIIKKGAKYFKREDKEVNQESLVREKAILQQEVDRLTGEIAKIDAIITKLL
jgi:hypothetical protein